MFDIFGTRAMRKEIELLAQQVKDLTDQVEAYEGELASYEAKMNDLDLNYMVEEAIQSAVDSATFTVRF